MKGLLAIILIISVALSMEIYSPSIQKEPIDEHGLNSLKYQCSYLIHNSIFSYKLVEDKLDDDTFNTSISDDENQELYFSFCNDSDITCSNLNAKDKRGSVLVRDINSEDCIRVSADKWDDAKVEYVKSNQGTDLDYLRLNWTGIDECEFAQKQGQKWKVSVDIACINSDYSDFTFTYLGGYNEECNIRARIENKIGCAVVNFNKVWEFLKDNQDIFAIILIVSGIFLTIAGYRIFIVTLFIVGVLVTWAGLTAVSYVFFIPKDAANYVGWIVLGVSFFIGLVVGFLLAKYRRAGVFMLSCCGGACIGLLVNNAVMRYAESQALFWIVIFGSALVLGIISCFLFVLAAILSTSLGGSYALVRGVSLFIGHFPNEMTIIEEIQEGIVPKTEWQFWVYLAVILVIFAIGCYIQWRFRPEKSSDKSKRGKNGEYFRI